MARFVYFDMILITYNSEILTIRVVFMKLRKIVSYNLKKIREDRGLNQADLAELCNMSLSAIQSYESMTREPKEDARTKIASALGIEEYEIYSAPDSGHNIKKEGYSLATILSALARHSDLVEQLVQLPNNQETNELIEDLTGMIRLEVKRNQDPQAQQA